MSNKVFWTVYDSNDESDQPFMWGLRSCSREEARQEAFQEITDRLLSEPEYAGMTVDQLTLKKEQPNPNRDDGYREELYYTETGREFILGTDDS